MWPLKEVAVKAAVAVGAGDGGEGRGVAMPSRRRGDSRRAGGWLGGGEFEVGTSHCRTIEYTWSIWRRGW